VTFSFVLCDILVFVGICGIVIIIYIVVFVTIHCWPGVDVVWHLILHCCCCWPFVVVLVSIAIVVVVDCPTINLVLLHGDLRYWWRWWFDDPMLHCLVVGNCHYGLHSRCYCLSVIPHLCSPIIWPTDWYLFTIVDDLVCYLLLWYSLLLMLLLFITLLALIAVLWYDVDVVVVIDSSVVGVTIWWYSFSDFVCYLHTIDCCLLTCIVTHW